MYINDTYIGFYLLVSIIGLFIGQFVDWINKRLIENKKIISKEIFRSHKINFKPNYILMIVTSIIYIMLIYKYGIKDTIIENLNLIKYMILTPLLLSVLVIDYKKQIIPNRLVLTMFEIGLIIAFLFGMSNVAITIDMILGMLIGASSFGVITGILGLIYGKDSMGLGDIKLIGVLGLYFGVSNIIVISIIAFLLGAISAVILIIIKKKKLDESISFGPFIVISSFISIFVPFEILVLVLRNIFTLGRYQR